MNEFAVIVGRSAKARKGTSLQNVLNVFGGVNRDWFDNRVKSGLSSGEGMIHAVRDALEVEEDIKEKGGKVTGRQTVLKDAGESDKRLLAIESEFARCLRVMEREGSTLSSILRDAWDNGKLSVLTKTPQKATEAHISVIGHITRDELCRLLTDTEAGNGFANRIIWIYSERSKLLPDGGNLPAEDFADLQQRLQNTIHFAGSVQRMHRDAAAKAMWHSVYPELTRDVPGLLGAVTSRAEAHTLRLSCIYALLDGSTAVRPEHMEAALAIWDYAEKSAAYIFGNALGDPVADEILRALQNNPAGMTRTELHKLFGNNAKSGSMQQALHTLAEQQRIKCASRPGENGGRPTELWLATTEETK